MDFANQSLGQSLFLTNKSDNSNHTQTLTKCATVFLTVNGNLKAKKLKYMISLTETKIETDNELFFLFGDVRDGLSKNKK